MTVSLTLPMLLPVTPSTRWTDGAAIRDRRKQLGWSQGYLAAQAGITRNSLLLIENGRSEASVGTLCLLARALGVPISSPLIHDPAGHAHGGAA